jgi:predicted metalloprotease
MYGIKFLPIWASSIANLPWYYSAMPLRRHVVMPVLHQARFIARAIVSCTSIYLFTKTCKTSYVVAHEVGHHIQNLLGTADKVNRIRSQSNETEGNRYSVMLELQADFYAGVWAHYAQQVKNLIEKGDIEEALNAANAIGDDRLQKEATGQVVPDAFTHGTSAQRVYWFKKGFETGDLKQGNTFE